MLINLMSLLLIDMRTLLKMTMYAPLLVWSDAHVTSIRTVLSHVTLVPDIVRDMERSAVLSTLGLARFSKRFR